MRELLSRDSVNEFLESFENNSEVVILEEAKKLYDIAKARGIPLRKNRDLSGFKAIYAFADKANANGAILPEKALLKALPSIVGKPVNIGHDRKYVVGHILDYAYQQKEKRVIVYGVFYKSCFDKEWEQAKKDFKVGKLNVSFEIWNPRDKRKYLPNGNYLMLEQEMAGMAILFRDTEPAFKGAKVLEFAKKRMEEEADLVCAEEDKYEQADINYFKKSVEENQRKMEEEKNPLKVEIPKIKCSNCEKEFESGLQGQIKCPHCFAIVNGKGEMIYPPQIKNFKILCPSCNVDNWLILKDGDEEGRIKCQSCSKEYKIKYAVKKDDSMIDKLIFLYTGYAKCYQCGKVHAVSGTSLVKTREITCDKCGLKFKFDTAKINKYKQIKEIEEFIEEPKDIESKSSEEGGEKKMDIPEKIVEVVKQEEEKKANKQVPSPEEKAEVVEETSQEQPKEEAKETQTEETQEVIEEPKEEKIEKVEEKTDISEEMNKAMAEQTEKDLDNKEDITEEAKAQWKYCVCPKCGYSVEKKAGDPCKAKQCPKCKTSLTGSNSKNKETSEEKSKKTKQQQRGKVIFPYESPKVKDNKDHFPINDANQARNALARVAQYDAVPSWYDGTLEELKKKVRSAVARAYPSIKVTKSTKTLRKAVKKIRDLAKANLEKDEKTKALTSAVKKAASLVISLREEMKKIKKESEEKIKLYETEAKTIIRRRNELGEEYSKDLSDKDILNNDKFERAKLQKENDMLKAATEDTSDIVGAKVDSHYSEDELGKASEEIDKKAFGKNKRDS